MSTKERKVHARGRTTLTRDGAQQLEAPIMRVIWVQREPAWEGADEVWSESRLLGKYVSWGGGSPGLVRP